jgi:hypothetical protein
MEDKPKDSLALTEAELREILSQMAQYPLSQMPSILFQSYCTQLITKQINQLKEEFNCKIEELMEKIDQ